MLFSEPKIPQLEWLDGRADAPCPFQCSSASRKFLNRRPRRVGGTAMARFSALQRAENSSISPVQQFSSTPESVSVLFSEPKIPQFVADGVTYPASLRFSALQRAENSSIVQQHRRRRKARRFSALQRAENSSIVENVRFAARKPSFQCSSASRKFLN